MRTSKQTSQAQASRNEEAEGKGRTEAMPTRLLLDERPLTVLPSLVKLVGMERAVILQQIHWLLQLRHSGIMHDGYKWVWGTHDQWCEDYFSFWKAATLRKHMAGLEKDGFLCSMQIGGFDRKKHYRVDYDFLDQALQEMDQSIEYDDAASIEHDRTQCIEHDRTQSMRDDHAASMRDDHTQSKRDDHTQSNIEKTSNKTSTETSNERMNECAPPDKMPGEDSFIHSPSDTQIEIDDCIDLLTDPEVGLDEKKAHELAGKYDFDALERHIFAWLAHRDKGGDYGTTGALLTRIRRKFSAPVLTAEQRRSELYQRFHTAGYSGVKRRHRDYEVTP